MPATLSFTFPSSETILWESRAEALAFFQSLTVADAALATRGVVKLAAAVSYTVISAYDEDTSYFTINFSGTNEDIYRKVAIDEIKTKLQTLSQNHDALLASLRNAGVLNS